jgi:hypothetical protein
VGASSAYAQPRITSAAPAVIAAGPDFATDVHADPWDFANVDDLSPFPDEQYGWLTSADARRNGRDVFLSGDRFSATTNGSGANKISMLFRGNGLMNPGRYGFDDGNAIPTSRYGKLAIKMRVGPNATGQAPYQILATWYHRSYGATDEATNAGQVLFGMPQPNKWVIYTIDLLTRQWSHDSGTVNWQPGPLSSPYGSDAKEWAASALVRGFELRATTQPANIDVEVEWVRLTAADSQSDAKNLILTFTGCTSPVLELSETGATYLMPGRVDGNQFIFNYGVLAPGTYQMRLACANNTFTQYQTLTINAPPLVRVLDPDETGGADFATDELVNAWDMNGPTDVPLLTGVLTSPAPALSGGELIATATSAGDPQVTLLNGGSGLISTLKYRKLTFTLTLETTFGLDGNQGDGSVARVFWGSSTGQGANQMSTTNDMLVWPGTNTYSIDLSALTLANHGLEPECVATVGCPQIPWTQRSVRFFRIDPHESTNLVQFRLGRVTLTAPDEVAFGNTFNIRYQFDDVAAGSTYRANIYLDGDRNPGGQVLIGTQNNVSPNTPISFSFNPSNADIVPPLNPNEYYVYVEIVETLPNQAPAVTETRGASSRGVLRVFNLAASTPRTTVSNPTANSTQATGFAVQGCAFDEGETNGINVDDIAVFAIPGPGITGPQAGITQVLGLGNTLGILEFGPLTGTPLTCPSASGVFADSGFRITNITGLTPGSWTLRVISRSTISGEFTTVPDIPFTVSNSTVAPSNLRPSGSGNTITLAWDAPTGGPPIGAYQIDFAFNSAFSPLSGQVVVPLTPTSVTGTLPNGTWFFRVRSLAPSGAPGGVSNIVQVNIPFGVTAPGSPVLTATQVTSNPITLSWAPGAGGAPTSYTVVAGTSLGGSDLGSFPLGGLTSISASAPLGSRIYVRVVASNAIGSATSNEINFLLSQPSAPGAPTGLSHTVSAGRVVSLNWLAPSPDGAATSYTVLARLSPSGPVIVSLPGVSSTSFSVSAPPGTYYLTVVAVSGAGQSGESNQVQVVVP